MDQSLYQPFFRRDGRIIIPGTSVKGVVRSYAEALSPSCEAGRCSGNNLCICCAIFGTLGFQGRITFLDAEPQNPEGIATQILCVEARWQPRLDHPNRRKFYIHDDYRKWVAKPSDGERLETVNEGTKFTCDIHFQNVQKQEIGLLLLAMGLAPGRQFDLKMGGGKNRGLGSVQFSVIGKIKLMNDGEPYTSFEEDIQEKALDDWGSTSVEEYLCSLSKDQRKMILNEVLQPIRNKGSTPEEGSDTDGS